jgi:hypothetical protein
MFPFKQNGFYVGPTLSLGVLRIPDSLGIKREAKLAYADLPLSLGYQFKDQKSEPSFLQLQVSFSGATSLSYGTGF